MRGLVRRPCPRRCSRAWSALLRLYGGEEVLAAARRQLPAHAADRRGARRPGVAGARTPRQAHPEVQHRLRPGRPERLCLLQRRALRGLRAGLQRRRGARRPLRRGRGGVRPQSSGGRLQPGPEGAGPAGAAQWPRAAMRAPWGEGRRYCAPRCGACASRARPWCASCPGHEHEGQEFECDRELVARRRAMGWCARSERRPIVTSAATTEF